MLTTQPIDTSYMERKFHIRARGSTLSREVRAGLTNFLTMSYIIAVNPIILAAGAKLNGQDIPFDALVTSTCLGALVMCLLMGFSANVPVVLASGMGINAVVAFYLMAFLHYSFAESMSIILMEGFFITVFMLVGIRTWIVNALPVEIRYAIAGGIGGFLWVIAAFGAGLFIVPILTTAGGTTQPSTAGTLGNLITPSVLLALFGILLTSVLRKYNVKGAILLGIVIAVLAGIVVHSIWGYQLSSVPGKLELPSSIIQLPNFSLVGVGLTGFGIFLKGPNILISASLAVFLIGMSDLLDTAGTFTALSKNAKLADSEERFRDDPEDSEANHTILRRLRVRDHFTEWLAYFWDSVAALFGGLIGASSITSFIEGLSGTVEGGRTGLTAISTAIPFGLAMFFSPLIGIIPAEATTGALMIVGALMMSEAFSEIKWKNKNEELNTGVILPVVFTVMFMIATWSISVGIGMGIILYVVLNLRQVKPAMFVLFALFIVYFIWGVH